MQYLLSVIHVGAYPQLPDEEMQQMYKTVGAFNEEIKDKMLFAGGLKTIDTATTVRVNDGATLVTDGPFAETKEILGGFWVIEAKDLDEALEIAKDAAVACNNDVEVRPFEGTNADW